MKKRINVSTVSVVVYWLFFLALLGLYFTNDFGLVDIHKTAIITAVGIDTAENEVQVTAEIAIPQPSQSGENIKYTQVQGSGVTIADALNEMKCENGLLPEIAVLQARFAWRQLQRQTAFPASGLLLQKKLFRTHRARRNVRG